MRADSSSFRFARNTLSLAILLGLSQQAAAEVTPLGTLGGSWSYPYALSSDGSTVVGQSLTAENSYWHAFRWTAGGGMQDLGTLGGTYSWANAVSADGGVVVGQSYTAENTYWRAFRWTESGGMQDLGTLGGSYSWANDVSADGGVVVGGSNTDGDGYEHAFRWTESGGMQDLGTLGGSYSYANAVSADGFTVVGQSYLGEDGYYHAFRWTESGGMQDLGTLGGLQSWAYDVSADGAVVVGQSYTTGTSDQHAFRWTESGGLQDLGTLGGNYSWARAVSADGTTVVGYSHLGEDSYYHAFRWTESGGLQDLGVLGETGSSYATGVSADGSVVVGEDYSIGQGFYWSEAHGLQSIADWAGVEDSGFDYLYPRAVSASGEVVTGYGYDEESGLWQAWIAREGGIINPQEWLYSVSGARQTFQSGQYLSNLALNGAHHRPLATYANTAGEGTCVWANGDWGEHGDDRDAQIGLAEVGVCGRSGNLVAGLSLGASWQHQSLPFDGEQDLDGRFVVGELNWEVPQSSVLLSALAMYGRWDADVDRGYRNGGAVDSSSGSTDVDAASLRLRADWLDAARLGALSIGPWAAFTATRVEVDGYTETGGGFPARFDDQEHTAKEMRLGVTGRYQLSAATTLSPSLEAVHRLDDQGPDMSGEAIGLFSFDLDGDDFDRNWLRVGLDVDHQVSEAGLLSLSLHGATEGQDPTGSVAVKYLHRL